MSEDRMREAMEKQAKQKALRDALDSQMKERVPDTPGATKGLSKAQQKFQELQKLRGDQQEAERQHQTMSLPPNFNVTDVSNLSSNRFIQKAHADVGDRYQTNSLPANFSMPPASPARPVPAPAVFHPSPPEPPRELARASGALDALPPRMVYDHKDLMGFVSKVTEEPPGIQVAEQDDSALPVGVARARQHIQKGKQVAQRREEKTVDSQAKRAVSNPRRPPPSTALGDKHMQVKVDRLQKELEDRDAKMHKLIEKERNWEQQMRDLKEQLKRKAVPQRAPPPTGSTRAETAPVSLPDIPASKKGKLEPLARPSNVQAGVARPEPSRQQQGIATPGAKATNNRKDFNSTKRYAEGAFRPITAPNSLDPLPAEVRSSASALPPLTRSGLLKKTVVGGSKEAESIYNLVKEIANGDESKRPPPKEGTVFSYNRKPFNLDDVVVGGDEQEEYEDDPPMEEESEMIDMPLAFHSKHGNSTLIRNELPVCLNEGRLDYFATNQIITWQQKERLWEFFQGIGQQRLHSRGDLGLSDNSRCEMVSSGAPRRPTPPSSKPIPQGGRRHQSIPESEDAGYPSGEENSQDDGVVVEEEEGEEGEDYEEGDDDEQYEEGDEDEEYDDDD